MKRLIVPVLFGPFRVDIRVDTRDAHFVAPHVVMRGLGRIGWALKSLDRFTGFALGCLQSTTMRRPDSPAVSFALAQRRCARRGSKRSLGTPGCNRECRAPARPPTGDQQLAPSQERSQRRRCSSLGTPGSTPNVAAVCVMLAHHGHAVCFDLFPNFPNLAFWLLADTVPLCEPRYKLLPAAFRYSGAAWACADGGATVIHQVWLGRCC